MTRSIVLIGAIVLGGCATTQTRVVSSSHVVAPASVSAGHVIVPASQQDDIGRIGQGWTPNEEMINEVERQIGVLFAQPDHRLNGGMNRNSSSPAPFPLSDYYVRYCGTIVDGKKLLIGKASHREMPNSIAALRAPIVPASGAFGRLNSRDAIIHAGGGAYFFTATFDADNMRLLDVSYNAPL